MPIPNDEIQQRASDSIYAFREGVQGIERNSPCMMNGMYGVASQYEDGFAVNNTFDPRLDFEDFGTMMGTLLGMYAAQHDWTSEELSGFLLRVVSDRNMLFGEDVDRTVEMEGELP